jgi:hypothetical protein
VNCCLLRLMGNDGFYIAVHLAEAHKLEAG